MDLGAEPPYINYRKIPKISPVAYIFQRPFLRSLFLEESLFGAALYIQKEIGSQNRLGLYWEGNEPKDRDMRLKNPVGLAYSWKEIYVSNSPFQ